MKLLEVKNKVSKNLKTLWISAKNGDGRDTNQ